MPEGVDASLVAERVAAIRDEARGISGSSVSIVAVTKAHGPDAFHAARMAGCDAVGENYAQELLAKMAVGPVGLPVHFIGRVQTNKVRSLAPVVSLWQSVDRSRVVDAVVSHGGPGTRVLLQVNATGEPDKGGIGPEQVEDLLTRARAGGLLVEGLMGVGPTSEDPHATEAAFLAVRRLCDQWELPVCSTGMSGDWRLALACGSTMLRLGTALFGPREPGRRFPANGGTVD